MLSLAVAVAISASIMRAASTLNESRFEPEYFTRNRKMPFERLLKFLLSMYKTSTQSALNKFFESKGVTMSQQALSKARNKFDHSPFEKLFIAIKDAFYGKEYLDSLDKLYDKYIIAIDGSVTPLPNLPTLLEKFGGTGTKASSASARMSIAYDVMNDFSMDRGYASEELILTSGEIETLVTIFSTLMKVSSKKFISKDDLLRSNLTFSRISLNCHVLAVFLKISSCRISGSVCIL